MLWKRYSNHYATYGNNTNSNSFFCLVILHVIKRKKQNITAKKENIVLYDTQPSSGLIKMFFI